jgi:hypothetical protein
MNSRIPESGSFRVIGVDTFDGTEWVEGDYETQREAIDVANACGGQMTKMHVYDKGGRHVHDAGRF